MDMPQRLLAAREYSGLSRKELGEKIRPPVKYETVRAWENGIQQPRPSKYSQIARITGTSLDWIATGAGSMLSDNPAVITPDEIKARVAAMSREERMLWLQEIANAESN